MVEDRVWPVSVWGLNLKLMIEAVMLEDEAMNVGSYFLTSLRVLIRADRD